MKPYNKAEFAAAIDQLPDKASGPILLQGGLYGLDKILSGFTDSIGDQEYNLGLSRRRAEAVGLYLAAKFNIDPGRIVLHWYGEASPVAGNDTEEGRMLNRRVDVLVADMK